MSRSDGSGREWLCPTCGEPTDGALYCSHTCFQEDDAKILESPLTGDLYRVTEWEDKGDGEFVSLKKELIPRPLHTDNDHE